MNTLTFLPAGFTISARLGDTVLDAALDQGFDLPHECGGNCACTTCHVLLLNGMEALSPMQEPERDRLDDLPPAVRSPHSRLACQAIVREIGPGLVVQVPDAVQ